MLFIIVFLQTKCTKICGLLSILPLITLLKCWLTKRLMNCYAKEYILTFIHSVFHPSFYSMKNWEGLKVKIPPLCCCPCLSLNLCHTVLLVFFCFVFLLFHCLQWSNDNQSDLVEAAGSLFRHALSILMPNGASTRQLPPSVAAIGPKSRVRFPLGMGHASEYIRHRVALIGYVHPRPL